MHILSIFHRFKQEKILKDFWNTTKQEEEFLRTRGSDTDCKSISLRWRLLIFLLILGTFLYLIGTDYDLDYDNEFDFD